MTYLDDNLFPRAFVLRDVHAMERDGGFGGREDVHVEDGRIVARGPRLSSSAPSLDGGGRWLMPGVFDCHLHTTMSSTNPLELMRTPVSRWALESTINLRRTLEAGVTSVRDAGGADAGIRGAIADGVVAGPRLQISVVLISQTGGHADGFLPGPGIDASAGYLVPDYPGRPRHTADGPDEMRRAVREVLRAGGDWIKLCTTGGFNSPHDDPEAPELTVEEVRVAVQEAARKGRHVMVHAFGGEGIDVALEAGVRSIEHGTFLTERQAARMAGQECWLVPTLAIHHDVLGWYAEGRLPAYFAAKAARLQDGFSRGVEIARAHGVPIAVGSDFFSREQHGTNLRELALLREAGLTAEETLLAATLEGARLCGVADELGLLEPGYRFDAILLDEEPSPVGFFATGDRVRGVFKDGRPATLPPDLAS